MTSKIKVDNIENQCGGAVVTKCGGTTTISGSVVKANDIQASDGGNLISQCGATITLGASGDTINLASGASQSGFGRTGTVDWVTTVQTSNVTAATGKGYFVNTTSGEITVNLPAGAAGAIVSVADYAGTADSNNIIISSNGSEKIQGSTDDHRMVHEREAVTMVYIDSTQGWLPVNDASVGGAPLQITYGVKYLVVAGGGGNGFDTKAGGGAGGYRASGYGPSPLDACASLQVQPGTGYSVVVGGGGAGSGSPGGTPGNNSSISTITAAAGGGGYAADGGSGSGQCGNGNTPPTTPPQGNPGGPPGGPGYSGGGGGAGGAGTVTTGGPGVPNTISPPAGTDYAGGGGSGFDPPGGSPGPQGSPAGGAGSGGTRDGPSGTSGSANTGGGAGGAGANKPGNSGGSGIVILRYATADAPGSTSGGTKSTCGSDTIHVFTGPGTFSA